MKTIKKLILGTVILFNSTVYAQNEIKETCTVLDIQVKGEGLINSEQAGNLTRHLMNKLNVYTISYDQDINYVLSEETEKSPESKLSYACYSIQCLEKIGKLLKKETIFCERVNGKFILRRGFHIKKGAKVLIIEDVITTGKSALECVKLIKKSKAKHLGFASIIDRSTKKSQKIKKNIISHMKIEVPTYKSNQLPESLKKIPITIPGSRFIK